MGDVVAATRLTFVGPRHIVFLVDATVAFCGCDLWGTGTLTGRNVWIALRALLPVGA